MRNGGRSLHLTLLVGFVAAACVYIFFLEPWGHDTWYHIQRMLDIQHQLRAGTLYAHFAGNAAEGKGLPVWIYYSQWIYWPPILLKALGATTLVSLKIFYCVLLIVCCAGFYQLLRLHVERGTAAFGTLLFTTSNYVIGEIFQRSAYAELCSVAFLPFLLVAVHGTLRSSARRPMAALVLLAALMILAHPLSFMNAGLALLAYTVWVAFRWHVPVRRLLRLAILFLVALALTSFYWLPAVLETRYVLGAEGVPTPLEETFLTIPRYFKFYSILSLGFVLTAYAMAAAGSLLLRRSPEQTVPATTWPLAAGIIVYVFLTLRVSEPLYANVPLLASNLWVWRVLFPLTVLVVLFVFVNFRSLPGKLRGDVLLRGLALLAVLQGIVFVLFYTWSDLSTRRLGIEEINGELAKEMTRLEGFGIDEYLPQPRVLPRPPTACQQTTTVTIEDPADLAFRIPESEASHCIHVPRYWNVRYAAYLNARRIPVFADAQGEILLLPEGQYGAADLRITRPWYVTFSAWLSGATLSLCLITLAWWSWMGRPGRTGE